MDPNIVYALVDPRTDEPRYVGKSTRGLLRPEEHGTPWRLKQDHTHKANWIRSLVRQNLTYGVQVLYSSASEENLSETEVYWIAELRRQGCRLTNHTDGGDGRSTKRHGDHSETECGNRGCRTATCSTCRLELPYCDFRVDRSRAIALASSCKTCQKADYHRRKSPEAPVCEGCGFRKKVDKNRQCARCNAGRGLRQCRGCGELLPIALSFQSGETYRGGHTCRTCLAIGTRRGRPRVFAEEARIQEALRLQETGKSWRQIAKAFGCSVPTIARLFRRVDRTTKTGYHRRRRHT